MTPALKGDLGRRSQRNGVVRGILVQIRQTQQKLQHAVALLGFRLRRAFLKVRDDRQGVGQQPFDDLGIDRAALAESLHDLIAAKKSLVEKMVEAYLLGGKAGRNEIRAGRPSADPSDCGIHNGLLSLAISFSATESSTFPAIGINTRRKKVSPS